MPVVDMFKQPLVVGDIVVFTNNVYEVKSVPTVGEVNKYAAVKIMLVNPSRSTRPMNKWSGSFVKIDPVLLSYRELKT